MILHIPVEVFEVDSANSILALRIILEVKIQ